MEYTPSFVIMAWNISSFWFFQYFSFTCGCYTERINELMACQRNVEINSVIIDTYVLKIYEIVMQNKLFVGLLSIDTCTTRSWINLS